MRTNSSDLELAGENSGQLYARECCANTWYAIGALRLHRGDRAGAETAFAETRARVPLHPLAAVALAGLRGGAIGRRPSRLSSTASPLDVVLAQALAVPFVERSRPRQRSSTERWLQRPPAARCWTLPVEPMLRAGADARWQSALARLRNRAA